MIDPGARLMVREPAHRLKDALAELLKALEYAELSQRNPWDFGVEIANLRAVGLTESDFRWLACSGYVQHAREITKLNENGRRFLPEGNLSFSKRTCFILTEQGASAARSQFHALLQEAENRAMNRGGHMPLGEVFQGRQTTQQRQHDFPEKSSIRPCDLVPSWDKVLHQLCVNGTLVKHFKSPAVNQETVLSAFAEEGWPAHIHDPLPPLPDLDPKRRLHDTIKCLNRNQRDNLIQFRGDGTGEGVVWELVGSRSLARKLRIPATQSSF